MDQTIIGDTVNLSARLESLTKQFNASILASKPVFDTTAIDNIYGRYIGKVNVVGRMTETGLMEILPFDCSKRKTKPLFEKAMEHIYCPEMFDPQAALSSLEEVLTIDPNDKLSQLKKGICQQLIVDSSDWTFSDVLSKK